MKSTHRDRLEENVQIFDFTLSDEDMAALDALDETGGTERFARAQVVVTAARTEQARSRTPRRRGN